MNYWPKVKSFTVPGWWGEYSAEEALSFWKAAREALASGLMRPILGRYYVALLPGKRVLIDALSVKSLGWRRIPRKLKKRVFGSA